MSKTEKARIEADNKREQLVEEFKSKYNKNAFIKELARLELHGNVIDQGWFTYLVNEKGKVQSNAIFVLSEIVYWYRPQRITDEVTGELIALKPKFHGDMLQKDYKQLAEKFGITKGQAELACKFLESKGLILLDFRTITTKRGRKINNVLFIGLYLDKLKEISVLMNDSLDVLQNTKNLYEDENHDTSPSIDNAISEHPIGKNSDRVSEKIPIGYRKKFRQPIRKNSDTNTKNINTKITTTAIIKSINQSSDNENFDIVDNKVDLNRLIDLDKQLLENNFKTYRDLINYVGIDKNCFEYPYTEYIDAIKKAIEEMYYFDYTKIKNRKIGRFDVISKLQNLQYDMIKACIDKVIESSKSQVIDYPVAFIKSTLFNEIDEYSARIQSQINYDFSDLPSDDDNDRLTRFHNFKGRTSNYTADELEGIANRKRKEYSSKQKTL